MCDWCEKKTKLTPQVSGVLVPMICTNCGTKVCNLDWSELRILLDTRYQEGYNNGLKDMTASINKRAGRGGKNGEA